MNAARFRGHRLSERHGKKSALPADLTKLVGRSRELSQVRQLLPETRLLTVTGVGGVGKSRLALGVGRRFEKPFGHHVWLVELDAPANPLLATSVVMQSVGVVERRDEPLAKGLTHFLNGGSALLLLDNCEHVLDQTAELVHSLLQACPGLRVLATSREPLGLDGEVTLALAPLDVPEPGGLVETPEEALHFGAIELFTTRVAAADPGFRLGADKVQKVIEICRRLEGIPLALELAAIATRALSIEGLRERLEDDVSLLSLSRRSTIARHRTLATTLDWSYDFLRPDEQLLWQRLSVFHGGFTIDAAEAVCCDDALTARSVFEACTGLIERSLIVIEKDLGRVRYRLFEPVRLYGLERLRTAGSEPSARARHLSWCVEWTAAFDSWRLGIGELERRRMVDEHANVLAALHFCVSEPENAGRGLELIDNVARAWLISGRHEELLHYGRTLIETVMDPGRVQARVLFAMGLASRIRGDATEAETYLERCRLLSMGRRGFELERGLSQYGLAFVVLWKGDIKGGASHLRRAIELLGRASATAMQVNAMLWLVQTIVAQDGDITAAGARSLIRAALDLESQTSENCQGLSYWLLGEIELRDGRPEEAEEQFMTSLRQRLSVGHLVGTAYDLQSLAFTAAATQRYTRAALLLGAADVLLQETAPRHPLSQLSLSSRSTFEAVVRDALGDEHFDELYASGKVMRRSDVVQLALGEERVRADFPSLPPETSVLTRREHDVACLIVEGSTNREIAAALVISDETVKFHVHNILVKLGFESRAEIAAWVARNRLC